MYAIEKNFERAKYNEKKKKKKKKKKILIDNANKLYERRAGNCVTWVHNF